MSDEEDIVDVFVTNYTHIDFETYQLWVDGYTPQEAVDIMKQRLAEGKGGYVPGLKVTTGMIKSEILNHYRTYSCLEKILFAPNKFSEQILFQIKSSTLNKIIERYYLFDDCVYRELLGKKLSTRHRRDLDELSEKTNVNMISCRRQFDNAKRICRLVEEMPGLVIHNIRDNFLISEELAKAYATLIFLGSSSFECNRKRVQYLDFQDFVYCSHEMMMSWTCKDPGPEQDDTEFDREFLLDLRDLRILTDKIKEHKHIVCGKLKPLLLERTYQDIESNFRSYSRAIIGIAAGLHRSREMRGIFIDLVEKCLEPWHAAQWTYTDLKTFLTAFTNAALEMDILREADLKNAWERYMSVLSKMLLRMYHL